MQKVNRSEPFSEMTDNNIRVTNQCSWVLLGYRCKFVEVTFVTVLFDYIYVHNSVCT